VIATQKSHLFDLTGLARVVERELGPIARRRAVRYGLFLAIVGAIVLTPLAVVTEARLRRLAFAEVPWEIAPHQWTAEPARGMKVRSLLPALGYAQKLDPRSPPRPGLNAWGFHDTPFEVPKPPNVARIVVIGDSMTYGIAAGPPENTFSGRLEAMLATEAPPDVRFDVANVGVEGYQALQDDAALRYVVEPYLEPDLVVYGFYENDLTDTSLDFFQYRFRYPDVCAVSVPTLFDSLWGAGPVRRAIFALKIHTALFAEYRYRRAIFRYEDVLGGLDRFEQGLPFSWARTAFAHLRKLWDFTSPCVEIPDGETYAYLSIRDMDEVTQAMGIPLVVFKIPQAQNLRSNQNPYEDQFLHYALAKLPRVHYVDAQPSMEARMEREHLDPPDGYLPLCATAEDCHPSALGHDYLAGALSEGLHRAGLVQGLIERVRARHDAASQG